MTEYERSFIDSALSSGLLGFTSTYPAWSRDRVEADIDASLVLRKSADGAWCLSKRQAATLCLTHQVVPYDPDSDMRGFVSPLHVSGVTSMAVLFLTRTQETSKNPLKTWLRAYAFYIAILSRTVYARVRRLLKKLYLSNIRTIFSNIIIESVNTQNITYDTKIKVDTDNVVKKLNDSFATLSTVYPYKEIKFSTKCSHDYKNVIIIYKDTKLYYSIINNTKFYRLFNYEYIEPEEIIKEIDDGYRYAKNMIKILSSKPHNLN